MEKPTFEKTLGGGNKRKGIRDQYKKINGTLVSRAPGGSYTKSRRVRRQMYNPREEARKKVWLVVAERGLQEEKESIYQIIVAQKKKV